MPKCETCSGLYGPNFTVIVNEAKGDHQCVFCFLGKDEITVDDEKTGREVKVTKEDARRKYARYLDEIYHSKKVQDLINPDSNSGSNIIKPY